MLYENIKNQKYYLLLLWHCCNSPKWEVNWKSYTEQNWCFASQVKRNGVKQQSINQKKKRHIIDFTKGTLSSPLVLWDFVHKCTKNPPFSNFIIFAVMENVEHHTDTSTKNDWNYMNLAVFLRPSKRMECSPCYKL